MYSSLFQLVLNLLCTAESWHCDGGTCRCKVTFVITCTVCVFSWYIKWGMRKMLMNDLLQREVWFCFTSRNENPFGKMSRWNSFITLSKLSLNPLPIPDDGGINFCRNVRNLLHFALVFF